MNQCFDLLAGRSRLCLQMDEFSDFLKAQAHGLGIFNETDVANRLFRIQTVAGGFAYDIANQSEPLVVSYCNACGPGFFGKLADCQKLHRRYILPELLNIKVKVNIVFLPRRANGGRISISTFNSEILMIPAANSSIQIGSTNHHDTIDWFKQ